MRKSTQQPEFVKEAMTAWKTCLPSALTNLFYVEQEEKDKTVVLKRVTAFQLELEEADKSFIKENIAVEDVHAVKIGMGCNNGKFAPIFCIITGKDKASFQYHYYRMTKSKPDFQPLNQDLISGTIAELLHIKWLELSDEQVKSAFFGSTVRTEKDLSNLSDRNTVVEDLRVNFYTYPQKDSKSIVRSIKVTAEEDQYLPILLFGAGLKVNLTHPFDFRPIIQVQTRAESGVETEFFERGLPCPPYCNTAGF